MSSGVYKHKPLSEETKRKMSEATKGQRRSPRTEFKKGHSVSDEIRQKISQNNGRYWLGKKRSSPSKEAREKMSISHQGLLAGPDSPHWKGGITSECHKRINSAGWHKIATKVRKRDNLTCQQCFESPVYDVHHLIPWNLSRNDNENNLVTLCRGCHMKLERAIK